MNQIREKTPAKFSWNLFRKKVKPNLIQIWLVLGCFITLKKN